MKYNIHRTIDGLKYKRCSKCKTWKELDQFPRNNQRWDNRHPHCKMCKKEANNIRRNKATVSDYNQYGKKHYNKAKELHLNKIKHNFATFDAFAIPLKRMKEVIGIDDNKKLLVKCSMCDNFYNPTVLKARQRIESQFRGDGAFCCTGCQVMLDEYDETGQENYALEV